MSVVISDTSPLRALSFLRRLDLLSTLFGEVTVPTAVASELARLKPSEPPIDLTSLPGVRVKSPTNAVRVSELQAMRLDLGESEAIALAEELQADLLLIDERRGSAVAASVGLSTLGVLGLLVQAKKAGAIEQVAPLIEQLRTGLGFFVTPSVRARILNLAGE